MNNTSNIEAAKDFHRLIKNWPLWATGTIIEFQQLSMRPLIQKLSAGEKFGPSWNELSENDWCMPVTASPTSERDQLVRRGFDIISALIKLDTCHGMLSDELKRRTILPPYDRIDVVLVAIDATLYTLQQRVEKFCKEPPLKGRVGKDISRIPRLIETRKKRRGMHTHEFNQNLIDSSSLPVLFSILSPEVENEKRNEIRKLIQREARRVFRKKIDAEITDLEQLKQEACSWVENVFSTSKPIWKKYLKQN